tara:strand:- start:472 stop:1164 length:693 start_codon:yes stop_codon:yes gene_type:complete
MRIESLIKSALIIPLVLSLSCSKENENPVGSIESSSHTIVIQPESMDGEDTYIFFGSNFEINDRNYSGKNTLRVSYYYYNDDESEDIRRSLLPIPDFSEVPDNFVLESANFSLYGEVSYREDIPSIVLKEITSSWNGYNTNWDNQPSIGGFNYDVKTPNVISGWTHWNVVDLVKRQLRNSGFIHGIELVCLEEESPKDEYGVDVGYIAYSSNEIDNIDRRPKWTLGGYLE